MLFRRSQPSAGYFSQPSQVVVRREPSRVAFISIVGRSTFRAEFRTFQSKERADMRAHRTFLGFAIAMGCGITLQSTAFSQEYRGTWEQQMACTPTSGGCAVRKSPMWTGSSLAYGEILRNSADSAARFLNKATTRPDVVRIATTGKGVTIGIMGRSVTTGTTGRGAPTMTTNRRGNQERRGRFACAGGSRGCLSANSVSDMTRLGGRKASGPIDIRHDRFPQEHR